MMLKNLKPLYLGVAYYSEATGTVVAEGESMGALREDEAGRSVILVEYGAKTASITLSEPMTDLLTEQEMDGRIELEPYGVGDSKTNDSERMMSVYEDSICLPRQYMPVADG